MLKEINSSPRSRKKYDWGNFFPTPRQRLQGQNTSKKLTELSETLNYKSFFKHCILQIILHVFL